MRVKTDYDGCSYITAGKIYDVVSCSGGCGEIIDDDGELIFIAFRNSYYLDGQDWEIINDDD